jgi:hypothetical protein
VRPLDEAGAQSALLPQAFLDAVHPAPVLLVIVAEQMEQAVSREDSQLGAGGQSGHADRPAMRITDRYGQRGRSSAALAMSGSRAIGAHGDQDRAGLLVGR